MSVGCLNRSTISPYGVLKSLAILGTLIGCGCLPEPALVCTVPVQNVSVSAVKPNPVIVASATFPVPQKKQHHPLPPSFPDFPPIPPKPPYRRFYSHFSRRFDPFVPQSNVLPPYKSLYPRFRGSGR